MFKNFDKVFKFTFKNQVSTSGYRNGTIITGLILFLLPILIFVIAAVASKDDDGELKKCKAEQIYVVDPEAPDADFNILNSLGVEGYTDIKYANEKTVEDALKTIKDNGEEKSLILQIKKEDGGLYSRIILPDSSKIKKEDAEHYNDFVDQNNNVFTVIASGISTENIAELMMQTKYSVYDNEGYKTGTDMYADKSKVAEQKNAEILPGFNMALTYVAIIIIYLIIILYGNSILQNIVLEKSSKLMDTMLISVTPESMIFGKMLAILLSGIMQLLIWLAAIVGGMAAGVKAYETIAGNIGGTVVTFLKSFSSMGIFKPLNVIIGILALIFGIILYASISAVAGAISSSREEAASNQGLFIMLLVISFYIVIFKGLNTTNVATWLYLLPFTSAMVLPSGISTGVISMGLGMAGLAILVVSSVLLIILAGRLYKMLALYKGNKVDISKAIKMLSGK